MKALLNNTTIAVGFIVLVASLVFIPLIGNCPLFDWDEINFAECAREMVVTGNYSNVQLNYNPFWEKPPFFIWLQAFCMNVFGINEFAARLPNAICGILTFCTLFIIGKKTHSGSFGLTWVLIYAGTLLPHFYFRSGIIDPWFNYFIFLSFYQIILHINNPVGKEGIRSSILAGVFLGLAVLTKGPAAILIIGGFAGTFWVLKKFRPVSSFKFLLVFVFSLILTGCSWFIVELIRGNYEVIKAFFEYQVRLLNTEDSGHGGPFFYHFIVLLIGCFPTSLFMLLSFKRSSNDTPYQALVKKCMLILFFIVLLIFSFIVETKIVHYSSMCYLPLTYLATYSVFKLLNGEYQIKKWFGPALMVIGLLIGIVFTAVGFVGKIKDRLIASNLIDDVFAVENLKADVNWQGWEWLIGLCFIIALVYVFLQLKKKAI